MSSIPSNLTRVPNILRGAAALRNITKTNADLLRVQQQIATGVDLLRPSDDIVRAAAVSVLDDRLDRATQVQRNLSHADAALGTLDDILREAHESALNAKSIASQQMSATASGSERSAQAVVIDQILAGLYNSANRQGVAGYALGGSRTSEQPLVGFLNGYRYVGEGPGLRTDLGQASTVPITLGQGNPLTNLSSRVRGEIDLNPALTPDTRLADLAGGRGIPFTTGSVVLTIDSGTAITIDLSHADTAQDVITQVNTAIRQYESDNSVTVMGPGGVSTSGGAFSFDVAAGHSLAFTETENGTTARDLGLTADTPFTFSSTRANGTDLGPRLTMRTPVSALTALSGPLGQLRITNSAHTAIVDLSGAQTLGDIKNRIEATNLGVRVRINDAGSGIDVVNEVASSSANSLSISEVTGGGSTATALGIRTLGPQTRISDFNFGRGVQIVDGRADPVTNTVTASLNTDIKITLGDAAHTTLTIDLRPQDMTNVQSVLDRINAEAAPQLAAAGLPSTAFGASLNPVDNGLVLTQDATFADKLTVDSLNNSPAAEQLGLLGGTFDTASATLIGSDRAKVRVDSVFTYMLDLRESLRGNSVPGIQFAAQDLDKAVSDLVEVRGQVGGFAQQVQTASDREDGRRVIDEATRSKLRDTDMTKAATQFTLLQTQLQAALQVTAATSRVSLLDFLS